MSQLIFQVIIKQWDKSQRSPSHVSARAALPIRCTIAADPAYFVLNKACIIDQHGDDVPTSIFKTGRIKTAVLPDGRISFDRFQICGDTDEDVLEYLAKGKKPEIIGALNMGWIQCQYTWRYGVEEGGHNYWMYEEVTLNAVCTDQFDVDYFLKTEPRTIFSPCSEYLF
ncbi:MAG: hypothetical protein ACI9SK_000387 [Zhongshania sp.]|jgi:hypothetical protein